jgi:hypothetical protein
MGELSRRPSLARPRAGPSSVSMAMSSSGWPAASRASRRGDPAGAGPTPTGPAAAEAGGAQGPGCPRQDWRGGTEERTAAGWPAPRPGTAAPAVGDLCPWVATPALGARPPALPRHPGRAWGNEHPPRWCDPCWRRAGKTPGQWPATGSAPGSIRRKPSKSHDPSHCVLAEAKDGAFRG